MRAPRVFVVSVLISICTLPAAGYSQTSNARTQPQATNTQNVTSNDSNLREHIGAATLPDSANNPVQAAPSGLQHGQRPRIPATPAPPVGGVTSPLAAAPLQSQAAVPQSVLFEFLFQHISNLNKIADKDDKAGKHISAEAWRTHDQRAVGLNDTEAQILREIALDCVRALSVQDAKIRASAEKFRAQIKPGMQVVIPPDLVQMVEDRKKIVSDHVERLREALGDPPFNKLDTYVHSSFHAEQIVPKPRTPSPSTTQKSQKDNK